MQNECTDGASPQSGLVEDNSGNLYGTTLSGGGSGCAGTAFELTPGQQTPSVDNFCGGGNDFSEPDDLIIVPDCTPNNNSGCTLYGTTYGFTGGNPTDGGVFSLASPPLGKTQWSGYQIASFNSNYGGPIHPNGVIAVKGNLFGTSINGGGGSCAAGCGTVFESSTLPGNGAAVLKKFCSWPHCTDGYWPQGGLISDANGNLYGTAAWGGGTTCPGYGIGGCGVVFELSPPPQGMTSGPSFCVLWNFRGGVDGANPAGGLFLDSTGHLYGTTKSGGFNHGIVNQGTVFELTPPAQGTACPPSQQFPPPPSKWTENVLYSFAGAYTDGSVPLGGVIMDSKGNLYGTTAFGGLNSNCNGGCGTVFGLSLDTGQCTSNTGWCENTVYSFCPGGAACVDGEEPEAGLIADESRGYLYGTTYEGGANGWGTVFEVPLPQ